MTASPLLELDTTPTPVHTVAINGDSYALRGLQDLPFSDARRFTRDSMRLGTLMLQKQLSPEGNAEFSVLLRWFVAAVLDAPPDVLDRLSDIHRLQIANAFITVTLPARTRTSTAKRQDKNRRRKK